MEEEEIIILLPPKKQQKLSPDSSGYTVHVIGGEPSKKRQREILRAVLKDLRED